MKYSFKNKDGNDIKGWFSDDEAGILYECAKNAPLNRILELGSFVGRSAIVLGSALKNGGTLICVDLFNKNQTYKTDKEKNGEVIADTFISFWENITERGLEKNILTLRGNYNNILPTLEGKFGMIFVDGGHTMQDTLFASKWAWEHLTEGGYLAFHDYNNKDWPDVKLCVDVLKTKWKRDFIKTSKNSTMVVLQK